MADPADRFFLPGAVGGLETVDDDDLDNFLLGTVVVAPTPVHPRTEMEDRLGSLLTQGCELASTLVHPEENIDDMGIVAATEALKKHILRSVPDWHDRPIMLQMGLGALAVFHLRPSDYTPVEEVNVLWALEGNTSIRNHGGVLYTYHGFSWRKFEGVFSSSTLCRIKRKMMTLEGLFRKFGTDTPRDRDSVINRIVALRTPRDTVDNPALDAPWFQHMHAAATGADPPRDGGDAPWTTQVIKAIIKFSTDMQNDLCGKRIVGNFVEWCDTPIARKPGFSTTDGCWVFADPDGSLQSVAPHPRNDIYLAVPHAASDPVLESHKRWVIDFLRTTFFDNALALECQLAAMCSTLRGMNTVRAFMTLDPGGVGQSLNTALVANVFGDMHGFVDMNVFYTEDELRKQADTFTGKVVITGQETPNTDKPLREDLYKKVMSGDPVAARLPYAILTKMVTFEGWKRFEMNSTMKFNGITEATFPSIMRRSLVILCKGRFVSAARLARIPPGTPGYFLMQEDMKDFVTSKPAAGALFKILMGRPGWI